MKIIKAGYETMVIPEPTDKMEVLKHLERIGRVCYKSEDKITDESCIKYLQNIRDRKHWAMLEHYIFVFYIPEWIYRDIYDTLEAYDSDPDHSDKINFIRVTDAGIVDGSSDNRYILSASATALNYLWGCKPYNENDRGLGITEVCLFMMERFPEIMKKPETFEIDEYSYDEDIRFISRDEMKSMDRDIRLIHDFMSVKFTVDRGVTHELVIHRPPSWAQESTRYCNYSVGKYDNQITVILPFFFDTGFGEGSNSLVYESWKHSCEVAEAEYLQLLKYGATPQQARSVLPQSTKAEIVMTARLNEWRHFFDMRAEEHAHPQMREVVVPLLGECINSDEIIFKDQSKYLL